MRHSCLNQDLLLEFASIPQELSFFERVRVKGHLLHCKACETRLSEVRAMWDGYFRPETEITSSLLRVYSNLQSDETLILKGWKLGQFNRTEDMTAHLFNGGWFFRGAVSMGVGALVIYFLVGQYGGERTPKTIAAKVPSQAPLAQLRVEDKNSVRVHYLEPQLLQTVEFETTRGAR